MEIEDRELVGVEYPGRVVNVDNMIKTLGGLTNLSKVVNRTFHPFQIPSKVKPFSKQISHLIQVCNMDKKRLDLRFRPDDVFSKPIYGDLKPASGLLMKVVFRRRRRDIPGPSTEQDDENDEPKIEIMGIVRSMIKFEGFKFHFVIYFLVLTQNGKKKPVNFLVSFRIV